MRGHIDVRMGVRGAKDLPMVRERAHEGARGQVSDD